MKVMMIGLSSAGKTSYMGAMYEKFRKGLGGFSIRAVRDEDDKALKRIGRNLNRGIYPSGTDIRSIYKFKLLYNGDELLDFDWTDYRGGILVDFNNRTEMASWERELNEADAVIVFLDATKMGDDYESKTAYEGFSQMEAIGDLISRISSSKGDRHFPISFVLTKCDLVSSFGESEQYEQLKSFIETIGKSKTVQGLMTGTVVGPECMNIQWPFLLSMVYCLRYEVQCAAEEAQGQIERAQDCDNNTSVVDDIGSWIFGESSYRELAQEHRREALKKLNQLGVLSNPLELLEGVLKEAANDDDLFMELF